MLTRIFLAAVGLLYVGLAAWCAWLPATTARAVGFELRPGNGQSEYLTVYGGLQLGLAILFLWPVWRPQEVWFPLLACTIVHGCLVLARTISLMLYSGIPFMTQIFAALEWGVFLGALALLVRERGA